MQAVLQLLPEPTGKIIIIIRNARLETTLSALCMTESQSIQSVMGIIVQANAEIVLSLAPLQLWSLIAIENKDY